MIVSTLENGVVVKKQVDTVCFDLTCDILCMGAGSAGVYLATAAAREGANVILCEISPNVGGMHVCGNVTGNYYGSPGGSYEEDLQKAAADQIFLPGIIHWEQKQIHVLERLQQSGVTVLCRHSAVGIYWEENRVIGLRVFDGKKTVNIRAAITVDATSDGHLVRMTDVKKHYGKPTDGSYVPYTIRTQYVQEGRLRSSNKDSGEMDHYDAVDFTKNTIFSHASAAQLLSQGEFVSLASQMGIREGLTFEGEDSVRCSDILHSRIPEKVLFWAYSDLDRHGSERATDDELFQNWWVIANLSTVTANIPVPMGSVVPKGIKGLITAGRCLSCDTYSQSAVRMNRDMFRMGECIGVAAAMAAASGQDFLDIDYNEYLTRAQKTGSFHGFGERRFGFDTPYWRYLDKMHTLGRTPDPKYAHLARNDAIYEPVEFDVERTFHLLKTDAPGVAIWSCYRSPHREATANRLFEEMMGAEDEMYRYNCAIALGLLNDSRALPVLRTIVAQRDSFFFTDNRRSNQFRSAVAVCLLGRMGVKEDVPQLLELLSAAEIQRDIYHKWKANYIHHYLPDRNFMYFAVMTHACMALYKIYQREGLPMAQLHQVFRDTFRDPAYLQRITTASPGEPAYKELHGFIAYVLKITGKER